MSPAVRSTHRYSEDPNHVPSSTAMRGTLDTSGIGPKQYDYDSVVSVFREADEKALGTQAPEPETPQPEPAPQDSTPEATESEGAAPEGGADGDAGGDPAGDQPSGDGGAADEGGTSDAADDTGKGDASDTGEGDGEGGDPQGDANQYADDPEFTPVGRTVNAVNAYLDTASPDERKRVLAIEGEHNARVGITQGPHAS